MEGRGTKRQSDSFSGNKAGFVSLGRPRKNSVSPQGAKVAEANVSQGSLGVAESPRRAEASSVSRENIIYPQSDLLQIGASASSAST